MQHRATAPGSASANSTHSHPTSSGKGSYTSSERRAMAKTLADLSVPFPSLRDSADSKQWCRERYESNYGFQG
jgi:hypothetical protein